MKTKKKREAESQIHEGVISWWREWSEVNGYSEGLLMHYPTEWINFVPSENRFAAKMDLLRKGYRKGTADLFLAIPRGASHGLWIELKTSVGKQSDDQVAFEKEIREQGFTYCLCRSEEDAEEVIEGYLVSEDFSNIEDDYRYWENEFQKLVDQIVSDEWGAICRYHLDLSRFHPFQKEIIDDWFFLVRKEEGKEFTKHLNSLKEMLEFATFSGEKYIDTVCRFLDNCEEDFLPDIAEGPDCIWLYDNWPFLINYMLFKVLKGGTNYWSCEDPEIDEYTKSILSKDALGVLFDILAENLKGLTGNLDPIEVSRENRLRWIKARAAQGVDCYNAAFELMESFEQACPWIDNFQKWTRASDCWDYLYGYCRCFGVTFPVEAWRKAFVTSKDFNEPRALEQCLHYAKVAILEELQKHKQDYGASYELICDVTCKIFTSDGMSEEIVCDEVLIEGHLCKKTDAELDEERFYS